MVAVMELKNLSSPDETRNLPKTKVEVVNFADVSIMRATFKPGWKWSECVRPTAGTKTCQIPHIQYIISGHMKLLMDDGVTKDLRAGDVAVIPPGHDAWVVGNEDVVSIDFAAGKLYGKGGTNV